MQAQIEQDIAVLIGLPLLDAGRSVDIEWFHFGTLRTVTDRKGQQHEVGTYALHLQCAWRLVGPEGIVVASRDRFYPTSDRPLEDAFADDFEWDQPGANRCDERMEAFLEQYKSDNLYVKNIRADLIGSLWIQLGNDYRLEVFPDGSLEQEFWRFFEPDTETAHFVVTGSGIERH